MLALLRKELREVLRVAVLWVVVLGLAAALIRLPHYSGPWFHFVAVLWLWLMPLFGLWLGAQALSRDRAQRQLDWQGRWPASRLQWWGAKVLVHLAALLVVFGVTCVMLQLAGVGLRYAPGDAGVPFESRFSAWATVVLSVAITLFGLAALVAGNTRGPMEGVGISVLLAGAGGFGGFVALADFLPLRFGPRLGLSLERFPPLQTLTFAVVFALVCLAGSAAAIWRMPLHEFRRRTLLSLLATMPAMGLALPALVGFWIACPRPERLGTTELRQPVALSPDRTLVAFEDDGAGLWQRRRVWVLDLTDRSLHCVARGSHGTFVWRPGTRQLLVEYGALGVTTSASRGWLVEADGRNPWRLPGEGSIPCLSPTGRYVAVRTNTGGLVCMDLAQGQLISWPALATDSVRGPYPERLAWLPDESGFSVLYGDGSAHLCGLADRLNQPVVAANSARERDLEGPWLARVSEPPTAPPGLNRPPAGTTFTDLRTGSAFTVPRLRRQCEQDWLSPDGRTALLADDRRVALVDMQTHALRAVPLPLATEAMMGPMSPRALWSPDGSQVALQLYPASQWSVALYLLNTQGPPHLRPWSVLPRRQTVVVGWLDDTGLLISTGRSFVRLDLSGRQETLFSAPPRPATDRGERSLKP